ncbi:MULTISPECIES: NAD(P)/FAD-dependent oxidoreductase [Mesorhizobium]|uniref:Gamma-Glu-putrescine oxidase n=2 Tax=Rhizobium loti TaxID=381 RepID=A0A6M7TY12_RHILI|nr:MULTISPECIES: FAD-binding oxidoreductase [Mesorhizobium]KRB31188.1 gamma-Glu-putrescine oxidase [Mesorhizobium sp. Root172]OBQ61029.1 gamma-Glu-putrescine oxidase [Mesorhizobium loti]QKC70021.1 FAD-binding oxidoreductase [Mesorhizobium loti]QKC93234.1 FAD-binding oxidoreductase [Mesorhizobium sp. NZP2234]
MLHIMSQETGTSGAAEAGLFADDYLEEPYWWSAAPLPSVSENMEPALLDGRADVVVVGSGITGLVAALHLAREGCDVAVLDAQRIGEGAARRNAGFVGRTLKRSVEWLTAKSGRDHAVRVYRELDAALRGVQAFVDRERIECHYQTCGRFIAANSNAHFRALVTELEQTRQAVGFDYSVVEKHEVRSEIASDGYHGGAVIPDLGSIHPGLYHAGLVRKALEAGVRLYPLTNVVGVDHDARGKTVRTSRGGIAARHVIIATNGYTSRDLKWLARRVIPFRGFLIATELLPPETIDRVIPHRRTYLDTKMNIDFLRPAPDSSRLLFGGMTGTASPTATPLAGALRDRLVRILPDLKGVRLSRAWTGHCAGTFDFMPHIGTKDGVHFALGYNFAGIPLGTHFGEKLAARILERGDPSSVFDVEKFPTAPFYGGSPWFVPLAMRYFDWHDDRIAKG